MTCTIIIATVFLLCVLCFSPITCDEREYVKLNLNSKWEFQCPHVVNVHSYKKIVVAWSLNDAIWLKIDAGNVTIINRLITFNRRQLGSSNVYTIVLNDFRYKYYYDEAVGDFSMTIQDTLREDSGLWQCRIYLHKTNGDIEELSTEAHILIGGAKPMTTQRTTEVQSGTGEDESRTNNEENQVTSGTVLDEEQRSAGVNRTSSGNKMGNFLILPVSVIGAFVIVFDVNFYL